MAAITILQLWNTILYVVLGVATAGGNSVVVLAVWKDPHKQLRKNLASYLIASLAVSNLVLVLGELMQAAGNVMYGADVYKTPSNAMEMSSDAMVCFAVAASVATVLSLAIERYVLLKFARNGIRRLKRSQIVCGIAATWLCSLAIALSRFGFKDRHNYRKTVGFVGVFMLLATMWLYLSIYVTIRHAYRADLTRACSTNGENQALINSGLAAQRIQKRQLYAARTIFTIVAALLFLWTPSIVVESLLNFSNVRLSNEQTELMYIIGLFNAAVDPGIYAFRTVMFRRAISTICCGDTNSRSRHHMKRHARNR